MRKQYKKKKNNGGLKSDSGSDDESISLPIRTDAFCLSPGYEKDDHFSQNAMRFLLDENFDVNTLDSRFFSSPDEKVII